MVVSSCSSDSEGEGGGGGGGGSGAAGAEDVDVRAELSKWTNYIHGWQQRFIVLRGGTLSYYKDRADSNFGCRGAISLHKATVKPHEFDECRFDVSVNDCVWYLRAETKEDRQHWVDILESYKVESGYGTGSENSLRRHGSAVSLHSCGASTASGGSGARGLRALKEKLAELGTFREILCRQTDTLQRYFDALSEDGQSPPMPAELSPVDFRGEAITFKATASGVLATLQHCAELLQQREDYWKVRMEREEAKRKRIEDLYKEAKEQLQQARIASLPGPDLEEGPHSTIPEDEFYDAVETGLDRIEEEREARLARSPLSSLPPSRQTSTGPPLSPGPRTDPGLLTHTLWPDIDRVSMEQLQHALEGVGTEGSSGWQIFAEEGDMRMYRREEEVDGMVMDPLKAVHKVRGVTGHEVCHFFFRPEYRHDWETTLEQMTVVENISDEAMVFLQTHKRIWPANQRDALFWSHMRHVPDSEDKDAHDLWLVCNHSMTLNDYPENMGKCVRVKLTVCLVCQTRVDPPKNGANITRDDITTKITYCSVVNPGGWAPASVLRAVYKREYPKFLKRFTQYVIDQCQDKPIMF
ncbi:ceramide transfer protein isoform X2 [Arctopsyche grandis]|uniref:ceramide transfer protein isoform X2 n=1 Tax=Arctopsyche grandis TaxID=121162 RepID=UPI00406D7C8F